MPPGRAPANTTLGNSGASKVPTRRTTRVYVLVAALIAFLAFILVLGGGGKPGGSLYVYKAKTDVAARERLTRQLFDVVAVSKDEVVGGAYVAASEAKLRKENPLSAMLSRYPIAKGSQLVESMAGGSVQVPNDLGETDRLISISAIAARSVGGSLRVGDHIDIIAVGGQPSKAALVLSDAEIVAVSISGAQIDAAAQRQAAAAETGGAKDPSTYLPGNPIPGLYTIKVAPSMAARLAVLDANAALYLTYRSPGAKSSASPAWDIERALCSGTAGSDSVAIDPTMDGGCGFILTPVR